MGFHRCRGGTRFGIVCIPSICGFASCFTGNVSRVRTVNGYVCLNARIERSTDLAMSAEAYYFAMYNANCSVPTASGSASSASAAPSASAAAVGPTPEACFFTMYNSNCSYVPNTAPTPAPAAPSPETQYFSRFSSEVRAVEAQRVASVAREAVPQLRPRNEARIAAPGSAGSAAETREAGEAWPSEAFDEVPQGTMTVRSFLHQLKTNLLAAEEGKPPGYLKAFVQKLFNFTATEVKATGESKNENGKNST